MARIGNVGEFCAEQEDFSCYAERLGQYLIANEVAEDKQNAVFLTVIGSQAYALLKSLLAPTVPSEETYANLVKTLTEYYAPKPLIIAERFKFHSRNQREGEGVAAYLAELRRLTAHCEFGAFLEEALRDRFVCGLRNQATQRRLLAVDQLTLKLAADTAIAMELAERNAQEFRPGGVHAVHKVTYPQNNWGKKKQSKTGYTGYTGGKKGPVAGMNPCFRCGSRHHPSSCKFKDETCFACSKRGHIAKKCPNKGTQRRDTAYGACKYVQLETEQGTEQDELGLFHVYSSGHRGAAYKVTVHLNGHPVEMEVDTGAAVSVISETLFHDKFSESQVESAKVQLKTFSGEEIPLVGQFHGSVQYENQELTLPVIVVTGNRPALLGRNWLERLKLNWRNVFSVYAPDTDLSNVTYLKQKFPDVFQEGIGTIKGFEASIRLEKDAAPIFCKPRPVPYALREAVEKELDRLEANGIITKVEHSQWATPIVVIPKADKSIRICGDYKVTVNRCVESQQYPLPSAEDIFATLAGGTVFSKLDLTSAYQQLQLDEQSQGLLTINTHRGLYRYNRLAFGVSPAPAIFQAKLEQILQGLDHVKCRLDDILVSAANMAEHHERLELVLERLQKYGVRLRFDKCSFMQPRVDYLGHRLDKDGLHPLPDKVEAIQKAPAPTNVTELKSYLGLLNYYGKFLPQLSTVLQPLHQLLRADHPWEWTGECEQSFQESKQRLLDSQLLVHYDVKKPMKLACDASSYGIGAVISHVDEDSTERPIAFASRTLSSSERNYSQLEKEALSIIYGVKKFHSYLYGRTFTLETDHKPLTTIFGPHTAVPTLAAARLQRWALILSAYQYQIVYRRSQDHGNADALSRCPVAETSNPEGKEAEIFYFTYLDELPVNARDISEATRKDPVLSRVLDFTLRGWPSTKVDSELQHYYSRRDELSTEQGCVLWGMRVIIPPRYRERLLDDLHETHPGMSRMKSLARSYLWWPGLDQAIESRVRNCPVCLARQKSPPVAPLHPWQWPRRVWQRLHIDYAECQKQNFLIVVDSHSKWMEVFPMQSTTSFKTIETLRMLFASYGLPEDIVSDNGPQFTSSEFAEFTQKNGIRHILTPPYHPASNGAAEKCVQTVKQSLIKQVMESKSSGSVLSMEHRLANFLLMYRCTPHSVTGSPPSELFLQRQLRNRFSLLKPDIAKTMEARQETQVKQHDCGRVKQRVFEARQVVRVQNFRGGKEKWVPGVIVKKLGTLTFLVKVGERVRYVHADHLLSTGEVDETTEMTSEHIMDPEPVLVPVSSQIPRSRVEVGDTSPGVPGSVPSSVPSKVPVSTPTRTAAPRVVPVETRRNPIRERKQPKRLDL